MQPPFGTISAVNLRTHELMWQIPAGTDAQRGPLGIPLHMPMRIGMPAYTDTMTAAGGLVFFAVFQDYYIRAYDSATGEKLWEHALPVGSSTTPMTYIPPKTGKRYVLISVGGTPYSDDTGDYVIASALPESKSNGWAS